MIRLPVKDSPRQRFSFRADVEYTIELVWNTVASSWFISVTRDGTRLLTGIRLALNINVLEGFYTGLMVALDASNGVRAITYDSLVSGDVRIYYLSESE